MSLKTYTKDGITINVGERYNVSGSPHNEIFFIKKISPPMITYDVISNKSLEWHYTLTNFIKGIKYNSYVLETNTQNQSLTKYSKDGYTIEVGDEIHYKSGKYVKILSFNNTNEYICNYYEANGDFIRQCKDSFDTTIRCLDRGLATLKKPTTKQQLSLKCECGVDAVGVGLHSTWCPKHSD